MKTIIDTGRKCKDGLRKGEPDFVLSAWRGRDGWNVNAHPSSYGSFSGGESSPDLSEAILPAIRFLLEHGESKELIVSSIFAEERAMLAQFLFGWM